MSCYHPLIGIFRGAYTDTGKKYLDIRPCPHDPMEVFSVYPESVMIPCGKCLGCRLDYSRQWADRMILELDTMKTGIFLTLTYNNDNVPLAFDDDGIFLGFTLRKKDMSDFMKVLRSRKKFEDRKIRFFGAGEYGPKTLRPHMHMIIFGLSLEDFDDRKEIGKNELNQIYFTSPELESIWNKGFILFSGVSWNTCAYVARYVNKKIGSEIHKDNENFEPEFTLMSRRPGIGSEYLDLHPDCLDKVHLPFITGTKEDQMRVPKYFLRRMELTDKEKFDTMREERAKLARDNMMLRLSQTSLSYVDQLEIEEQELLNHTKILRKKVI